MTKELVRPMSTTKPQWLKALPLALLVPVLSFGCTAAETAAEPDTEETIQVGAMSFAGRRSKRFGFGDVAARETVS
jgi:hypothetical protein